MYLIKFLYLTFANLLKQAWLLPQTLQQRSSNNRAGGPAAKRGALNGPEPQQRAYQLLAVVFGVAGLVWVIYGLLSPRWVLYPLIGLANLAIAYLCKRRSASF